MRLAVVGLGKAGLRHVQAALASERVELKAVADSSSEARSRAPRGVRVVDNLDAVADLGVEAVVIAVPHALLHVSAQRALEVGLHVLVEKPMASRLAEARRLVATADALDRRLMVNYNHRFRDEYRMAHRMMQEGRVGRPRLLSVQMVASAGALPHWVWDPHVAGGGMMTYNGAHPVDHLLWLTGQPVREVWATMEPLHFGERLEDTCLATLRFDDGALAHILVTKSNVGHDHPVWETRVEGTEGSLVITTGQGIRVSCGGSSASHPSRPDERFRRALDEFASAVVERRSPTPGGPSGLKALQCLEALYRSAAERRWVKIEQSETRPLC